MAMNIEKKLYQWDTEQKLTGCTGLYVDFPIGNEVYRVETADGTCIIPDELLQTSGSHKVYECMTNNTIRSFAFSVTPRPKPPDYVYTPTERLTFEGLVQRVDDAVADMIRRAESGEFDGHTPVKGTDYFTTGEIQQIQNEVSSGAIGEFKSVVDTETETFNTNAESKLTTYNENDVAKTGAYNTNASDKLDDYNTNASNKVTEYNSNAENKTAEFDTHTEQIQADISELKSDLVDVKEGIDNFGYYATFVNGGMSNGVVDHNYNNRVTSDTLFEFDRDITITPKEGFRFFYSILDGETYKNYGFYHDSKTIPKGTKFRIVIARITENPVSYYEDIDEFVSSLLFETAIKQKVNDTDSYVGCARNSIDTRIEVTSVIYDKYLDSNGNQVSNNGDELWVFSVKEGKTVTFKNILNASVRFVCGFKDGQFVKAFEQYTNSIFNYTFNTTGIDTIAVSRYTKDKDVIAYYNDYSTPTKEAIEYINKNSKINDFVGNYLNSAIEFGNPSEYTSGYIKANGVDTVSSESYKYSDYIHVYGGKEINAKLLCGAERKAVHFYDGNKTWIGGLDTEKGTIADLTFTTPKNARYIRVNIQNEPANFSKIALSYTGEIERNFFVNDLVNGWYEQGNRSIDKLFKKATSKPILTLIDDDTPTVAATARYHDACVNNGVVGCYAVITKQLESQNGLAEQLKSYEREGFQNLLHCHDQAKFYNTSSSDYNIANAEADLVQGIQEIIPYGFANWRYWCTPYGVVNDELASLAKKWGLKCLIRSGLADYETTIPHARGKYQISRISLNQNDEALQIVKNALDGASLCGGWVLVTTHMAETGWDSEESQARFTEMITYAKSLGFEIKTVAEALEIREPIYRFHEMF